MKTLLICTGKPDWIMSKLLPSLYEAGRYTGEVLIFNYGDFEPVDRLELQLKYEGHVGTFLVNKQYQTFTADRFRAFNEVFTFPSGINVYDDMHWYMKDYDVIIHVDGNDIEFFQDINPLITMASKKICVIPEPRNNDNAICKGWVTANSIPKEFWDAIGDKPVLNCGVFAGPSKKMYQIFSIIAKFSEHDSRFGIDQLIFNALFYYYKVSHRVVDRIWDWHYYDKGWVMENDKPVTTKISDTQDESIWVNFEKKSIAILHYAGPQSFKKSGDRAKPKSLNSNKVELVVPNTVRVKAKKRNWLFP